MQKDSSTEIQKAARVRSVSLDAMEHDGPWSTDLAQPDCRHANPDGSRFDAPLLGIPFPVQPGKRSRYETCSPITRTSTQTRNDVHFRASEFVTGI